MRPDQKKDGSWINDYTALTHGKCKSPYSYDDTDDTIIDYSPKHKKNAPKLGQIIHMCDVGPVVDDFNASQTSIPNV